MIVQELFARLGFEFDEASFKKAEGALEKFGKTAAGIGAVFAGAFGGLAYEVSELAKSGQEIDRTAQQVGVGTDALQELREVAESTGLSTDVIDTSLKHLSRTAFAASQGAEEMAYAFEEVGVSIYGTNGQLKPADKLLEQIADKFAKMPDGTRKTALSMQLFSKGGAELIPILNKGSKGIDELKEHLKQFGAVLDKDTIEKSKKLKGAQFELKESLEGLKVQILGPLIPAATKMAETLSKWFVANRQLIASGFEKFLWLVNGILTVLTKTFTAFYNAIHLLTFAGIPALVLALGALLLWLGYVNAAEVALAVIGAIVWLVQAGPILAIIALIAFIVLALDDLYTYLSGGDSVIGRVLDAWKKKFGSFGGFVKAFFGGLKNIVEDWVKSLPLGERFIAGWDKANKELTDSFGKVSDFIYEDSRGGAGVRVAGGGASPNASILTSDAGVRGGNNIDASLTVGDINITSPGNPQDIANGVKQAISDHHDEVMRKTNAQLGAPLY